MSVRFLSIETATAEAIKEDPDFNPVVTTTVDNKPTLEEK
jgi:hypothetical protein